MPVIRFKSVAASHPRISPTYNGAIATGIKKAEQAAQRGHRERVREQEGPAKRIFGFDKCYVRQKNELKSATYNRACHHTYKKMYK